MTQSAPDQTLPMALPDEARDEITRLADRQKKAKGPVMTLITRFGGKIEDRLPALPARLRAPAERITWSALENAYALAKQGGRLPLAGDRATTAAALTAGAAGGAGGLPGALAELPLTITLLLHAIRREAVKAGFDPDDPWIMAEALRTFASGSPIADDDGIDTGFLSARVTLTGPGLQQLLSLVAPRLAASLGQKLAAQAVPVIGAVSGAALNAAFLRYYREMAAIRFALLRLAETHGAAPVLEAFTEASARAQPLKKA